MKETPGDRLVTSMKRAGVKNDAVARAAGVHVKTVSYWRSGKQKPGDAEIEATAELLRQRGVPVTAAWLRYGDSAAAPVGETDSQRVWLAELQLELVRDFHATNQEIAAALALVQCPEAQAFIATAASEDTRVAAMEMMARAIRLVLADRRGMPRATNEATSPRKQVVRSRTPTRGATAATGPKRGKTGS